MVCGPVSVACVFVCPTNDFHCLHNVEKKVLISIFFGKPEDLEKLDANIKVTTTKQSKVHFF